MCFENELCMRYLSDVKSATDDSGEYRGVELNLGRVESRSENPSRKMVGTRSNTGIPGVGLLAFATRH